MKKSLILILLSFCLIEVSFSQNETKDSIVERNPEFPGGFGAFSKFIYDNIKYPDIAKENGIQGKVYIKFVVLASGKIGTATVVRGVHPSLDREAVRVIKSMPSWKPGFQKGKAVPCDYTIPINFVLDTFDDDKKKKKKKR